VADYFTPEEQALVGFAAAADRARLVTLLWSAKESALKALHTGLRLDTRAVIVSPVHAPDCEGAWRPLHVRQVHGPTFRGWWQHTDGMVRTLVAAPPPRPPVECSAPAWRRAGAVS
jgi:4'-phosphopantetheinyl transferase EntD